MIALSGAIARFSSYPRHLIWQRVAEAVPFLVKLVERWSKGEMGNGFADQMMGSSSASLQDYQASSNARYRI